MPKQLTILSDGEISKLYDLPKFDEDARQTYFDLNDVEKAAMNQYSRIFTKTYFVLQLGYFKAKQLFFVIDVEKVHKDAEYIRQRYFPQHLLNLSGKVSKPTRLEQQKAILKLFDYQVADEEVRATLVAKAEQLARLYSRPIYIFRELLNYLEQQKIVLLGYSVMQKHIIAQALIRERLRLETLADGLLNQEATNLLQQLLEEKVVGTYLLTWLQQEPSSFKCYQMRGQVLRKQQMEKIYLLAQLLIPKLEISNENIRYYATLAEHYSVFRLKRMKRNMVYIYLLCFAYSRFRHINDTLIEAFKHYVRTYEKQADGYSRNTIYAYQLEGMSQLIKVPPILSLFTDDQIADTLAFGSVRRTAFAIMGKKQFSIVSDYITKNKLDKKELKRLFYESIKQKISLNIRYLFVHLTFKGMSGNTDLMQAIDFTKPILAKGRSLVNVKIDQIPCLFIPNHQKKYFYKDGVLLVRRYEFYMLQTIRNRIDSGDIYIPDSFVFKSFDQDLIPKEYWQRNKKAILESIEAPRLRMPIKELLADLKEELEAKFKRVNESILKGENKYVKIDGQKPDGSTNWTLQYPSIKDKVNHKLFSQFKSRNITELMDLVHGHTGFMDEFIHILGKDAADDIPTQQLIAAILALGTNHGVKKMAQISDMTVHQLNAAVNNFIRNETLEKANVKIVNATSKLPMFQYYNIEEDQVHSSSDGQKFGTKFDTINSRYSPKYYGLGKGLSDYTMVANHIPVNAKIIGTHEHESYFVFDLLYNNETDIQPEIHSTDTDGTNQINFAILDFFGYQFAPRYASITSRAKMIHTFEYPSTYPDNYLLKSKAKIDTKLVEEEWDNFQRIVASLGLKTTTQSTIIKKLSSYTRNNRTQQAIIEYDKILKSLYLLEYIDSPSLRRNVQKALNRGEEYHQLKRHIFYVHGGKFRVHTIQEQQVIANCTHLIANVIIYYNTWLLSQLLEKYEKEGNTEALEKVKKIAPIAWQHINVYGTYKFIVPPNPIDPADLLKDVKL